MLRPRAFVFALALTAAAQQPPVSNAVLQTKPADSGLESTIRSALAGQSGPVWIGYAAAKVPGDYNACCWTDDTRGCGLEGQRSIAPTKPSNMPVQLEGPTHVSVLLRYEQGAITKLRSLSIDCALDAGGLPLFWLTGVKPAESVKLLHGFTTAGNRVAEAALHAIAMHSAPQAGEVLERIAKSSGESSRKTAMFWLANTRGRRGYEVVAAILRTDPSDKVREHAIFALTRSKEKDAIADIVRTAKEDTSPRVRGQALFWLGQKAASAEVITEAIERDPDTEVKKKAVFALSQLPKDQSVPQLIRLARTNTNPAVRRQAMFWLGQSKDSRALDFLAQVVAK